MAAAAGAAAALLAASPAGALAQGAGSGFLASRAKSGEKISAYQPSQINHPIPKYDYTDEGRVIMLKRYPRWPEHSWKSAMKYTYIENTRGVEHVDQCEKLKREPQEILSEEQKAVLAEWGQPEYLRGPFTSTRGDSVVEWAYHQKNHIFQFVNRTMVYEGALTDQDRTAITFGKPRHVIISQQEPNIRRETWVYDGVFLESGQKLFNFANGKQIYAQETP